MANILSETQILSFAEFTNPYLRRVKFVFADDRPNLNNQVIPYEEFAGLSASAVGMPIKIRFLGRQGGAGNHEGSVPIGHISEILEEQAEDGSHKLIADGLLYADEYPDIIEYLENAYAENKAPGISWEISYHESIIEKGITLLKGVIARAATFVKHPAYGKRTALLALASIDMAALDSESKKKIMSLIQELLDLLEDDTEEEDITEAGLISKAEELVERFIKEVAEVDIQGGNNNVTLEEALAKIVELEAEIASSKEALDAKASEIQTLGEAVTKVEQLEATITELETAIAAYEKAAVVADRTQKMVEAGVVLDDNAEVLAQKQELWAAMSEEIFTEVVSTVAAVASKAPDTKRTEASARIFNLPKITPPAVDGKSVPDLMSRMRALSRNDEPAE